MLNRKSAAARSTRRSGGEPSHRIGSGLPLIRKNTRMSGAPGPSRESLWIRIRCFSLLNSGSERSCPGRIRFPIALPSPRARQPASAKRDGLLLLAERDIMSARSHGGNKKSGRKVPGAGARFRVPLTSPQTAHEPAQVGQDDSVIPAISLALSN